MFTGDESPWYYLTIFFKQIVYETLFCRRTTRDTRLSIEPNKEIIPQPIINFDIEYLEEEDPVTLIDQYKRKLESGLITRQEFDEIEEKITELVLPRNLSHDSVSKNKIIARRMNNKPEEITEEDRLKNFQSLQESLKSTPKSRPQRLDCGTSYVSDKDFSYRPKRSSSLKTPKDEDNRTEKKVVRFADALGLDLEVIKNIFDTSLPPVLPISALSDLDLTKSKEYSSIGLKLFQITFPQPCSSINFYQHVLDNKVKLENANIDNTRQGSLFGIVRVKSLSLEKDISVRITYNNWVTFQDVKAAYVIDSHDGVTDKFSFSISFPETLVCGDKAEFAVTYQIPNGEKFWDNNNGGNYHVVCYSKQMNPSNTGNWMNIY